MLGDLRESPDSLLEAELQALTKFAPIYQALEGNGGDDQALNRLGAKLNVWEVTTAYPLVFQIAASPAPAAAKAALYQLIYSYLVRRAVCGLTPKNLNKTFSRLVSDMLKSGVSRQVFAQSFLE